MESYFWVSDGPLIPAARLATDGTYVNGLVLCHHPDDGAVEAIPRVSLDAHLSGRSDQLEFLGAERHCHQDYRSGWSCHRGQGAAKASGLGVDIYPYGNIIPPMPRAATTVDAFNAVAEPRRRQILHVLSSGEQPVNDVVAALRIAQPQVSKHLRVLKEVGLVTSRSDGRQRLYRLNGEALKPIHDWVMEYERHWNERLDRLDEYLDQLQEKEERDGDGS
jgi:DNA-binding transcriptional ArsR family regulator